MQDTKKSQQIIEQIEALLTELKQLLNVPSEILLSHKKKPGLAINQGRGFSGLTGKIYELIEEGFFNEPKTISDLQKKLKDRAINKPTTALMPSLKLLITKRVLDRNKPDKGIYEYFKK